MLISQNACQHEYYSEDEVNEYMLCAAGKNWEEDACQVNKKIFYFLEMYPWQIKLQNIFINCKKYTYECV